MAVPPIRPIFIDHDMNNFARKKSAICSCLVGRAYRHGSWPFKCRVIGDFNGNYCKRARV
jgi:hypothetical protein